MLGTRAAQELFLWATKDDPHESNELTVLLDHLH